MFRRITIGTDLTDGLYRLAQFVPSLAAGGIEEIVFAYVVPFEQGREMPRIDRERAETARERLNVAQENVPDGVTVRVELPSGRPVDKLLELARTYNSEAIVLGTSNRTLLDEKLFGSTTAELSERAGIPLLAVRPPLISTYTCEELDLRCRHLFRYLLLPYDGSDSADTGLERLKHYARNRPDNSLNQCLLACVVDIGERRQPLAEARLENARKSIERAQTELAELGLEVQGDVRRGEPLTDLLEMALEYDVTAIAVAASSLPKILDWSRSSLANKLLRQSWHPVLFFPSR